MVLDESLLVWVEDVPPEGLDPRRHNVIAFLQAHSTTAGANEKSHATVSISTMHGALVLHVHVFST